MCLEMSVIGRPVAVILTLVALTAGLPWTYAQVDQSQIPPLSIKVELPLYDQGDSVVFSGKVKNFDPNDLMDVTVRVIGPLVNGTSSNIVQVKQIKPQLDGSFEGSFIVSGPLWQKKGDYKILVNYGHDKAETKFFFNGGSGESTVDVKPPPPPPTCGPGEVLENGVCVPFTPSQPPPTCGPGTHLEGGVCVPDTVACGPNQIQVNGKCVDKEPEPQAPVCGPGTRLEGGICVPEKAPAAKPGGCLIATATFGTELAPQVQLLREVRDSVVFRTHSGTAFMSAFNDFYYSFSPTVADWERQNPAFKEVVKVTLTPMLSTLSILNYVEINSEQQMLGYGIGIILLNIGMYFVAPAVLILKLKGLTKRRP